MSADSMSVLDKQKMHMESELRRRAEARDPILKLSAKESGLTLAQYTIRRDHAMMVERVLENHREEHRTDKCTCPNLDRQERTQVASPTEAAKMLSGGALVTYLCMPRTYTRGGFEYDAW